VNSILDVAFNNINIINIIIIEIGYNLNKAISLEMGSLVVSLTTIKAHPNLPMAKSLSG